VEVTRAEEEGWIENGGREKGMKDGDRDGARREKGRG